MAAPSSSRALKMDPQPAFIQERISMFDRLYAQQLADVAAKAAENKPITVTFPDGRTVAGVAWKTTPFELALAISKGLADSTVIAKVNGEVWDLDRPFEGDATVEFLKFDDKEAEAVFWHSSAHVLGEAMEQHYGCCLCYGPPIENGFYYDMHLTAEQLKQGSVTPDDFGGLTKLCEEATGQKQPFQRLEMTKADLLEMFRYNEFKCRILNERIDTPTTTVYRCGPLIDLCRGPHVRDTGKIKAIEVVKASSTYWEGNAQAETLTRIYGISFPDKKQLKEWKVQQEEAAKRDHRRIGMQQELFFFHELSPGSCFFLPKGAHIYNTLVAMIREQYVQRGFSEVVTPNMFNSKLWQTSGHWEHYAENMFHIEIEKETYALKPMNCPGHCLMFAHRVRSYRELPLRFADFGVLHRNEASGALTGLTRVRRFQQDDAHIFCMPAQVEAEIESCLQFLQHVYGVFGFSFELNLSTRPKNFLGEIATWDKAEAALKKALTAFGHPWKLNPEDGAFYGPKIDITIKDALNRSHQCATIQLDFQLPIRFDLEYNAGGDSATAEKTRPIIIHRAILGSVERMIAILTESFAGKWPLWLSPRQAMVVPVQPAHNAYAVDLAQRLKLRGFQVDVDTNDGDQLPRKIRNAQLAQYNFMLVVGTAEMEKGTVNVRTRDNKTAGEKSFDEVVAHFTRCTAERRDIEFEGTVENAPVAAVAQPGQPSAAELKAEAAKAKQQAKMLEQRERKRAEAAAKAAAHSAAGGDESAADPAPEATA